MPFVKLLDEPHVIVCLSCHPGNHWPLNWFWYYDRTRGAWPYFLPSLLQYFSIYIRALRWVPIPMPMGFGWAWVHTASSSKSESNFPDAGNTLIKKHFGLKPTTMNDLLFVWSNQDLVQASNTHYTIFEYMGAIWITWVGIGRCWWLWSEYGYKFEGKCWALIYIPRVGKNMTSHWTTWE
jgi:hypothetical protein